MYKSDEDKMMSDPKLKWSQSSVIKKEKSKQLEFDFSEPVESKEIKVNTKRLTDLGLIK